MGVKGDTGVKEDTGAKGDPGAKGDNGTPCQCSLQVNNMFQYVLKQWIVFFVRSDWLLNQ